MEHNVCHKSICHSDNIVCSQITDKMNWWMRIYLSYCTSNNRKHGIFWHSILNNACTKCNLNDNIQYKMCRIHIYSYICIRIYFMKRIAIFLQTVSPESHIHFAHWYSNGKTYPNSALGIVTIVSMCLIAVVSVNIIWENSSRHKNNSSSGHSATCVCVCIWNRDMQYY